MAKPIFTELKSKKFKYTHTANLKTTSLSIMTFQDYYSRFKYSNIQIDRTNYTEH